MNTGNNERFHELAHKALAKEATKAEQRELRAFIAENPKLKEEMEQLGGEAGVIRELLPLLEDLQQKSRGVPDSLMDRLRTEVGEVLDANKKSKNEIADVLARLETWARQQVGASREEVTALVALLRGSLLAKTVAAGGEELTSRRASHLTTLLRESISAYAAPRLMGLTEDRSNAAEAARPTALEQRLIFLEARFRQAEEITRGCREELRSLLEAFARDREADAERRGQNPNPVAKPKT